MRPRGPEQTPRAPADTNATAASGNVSPGPVSRLVIVYPRTQAAVHTLGDGESVLGRHPTTAIALGVTHPTVSRRHVTFRWDPAAGRHTVVDLGSRNGTWLNGQSVGAVPRLLEDQAVLRIGSVIAVYERQDHAVVDPPEVSRAAVPGDSLAAQNLRAQIHRAAPDPAPALLLGESGTGRASVAVELHRLGGHPGPQRTIDCTALGPDSLPGITADTAPQHPAEGGSLFLDDLGELSPDLQPMLLRLVQPGTRLIASTRRPLPADLHAGLAACAIVVPPLRARRSDLLGWVDVLHAAWCTKQERRDVAPLEFQPDAAEALLLQPWPDNLRGLKRFVHASAAIADPVPIHRDELGPWLAADLPLETDALAVSLVPTAARSTRPRPSREALLAILQSNGWSIRATAKHYERDRKQITRWIEMYAIETPGRATE